MKNLILLGLILLCGNTAFASAMGYGLRNCSILSEERGLLRNNEICVQEFSCQSYQLRNPNFYREIRNTAYCRPTSTNRCPSVTDCIADETISAQDIPHISPLVGRPSSRINCDESDTSRRSDAGTSGRSSWPQDRNAKGSQ